MRIVVIFAGGTGQRMHVKDTPKQFLELHGKPIIVYTLEHFQSCEQIDHIVIVCLEKYIPYCEKLMCKYGISKVSSIIAGGKTGQQSIYLGLTEGRKLYGEEATVLVHDGVRPLINEEVIKANIASVASHGNGITVSPAVETILTCADGKVSDVIDRSSCIIAKAPQSFVLGDIFHYHQRAREEGLSFIDCATLMHHYGIPLYPVLGPSENIKITTPSDFYFFKAMVEMRDNSKVFGYWQHE